MDRRLTFTIIMIMVFHYTTPAFSSPHDCPKTLSMYAENALTLKARKIFETMYAKLGCSLNVRVLPPKRSILYFNRALIDGELYRLEDIEKKYTRTFVRSRFPLLSIPVSLWAAADKETYETRPLGYVKGYAWQERFVSKKPLLKTVGYMNENDLYLAFNKGIVGSFINNDPYVEFLQQDGILTVPVTKIMTVETRSFYHYLNAKYAPFMDRFSDLLAKEKNFNIFDKQ